MIALKIILGIIYTAVIFGAGVKAGRELHQLNEALTDEGVFDSMNFSGPGDDFIMQRFTQVK